ncbi:MAG: CD225/dispanin family protein [Aridibacter famidurans]|nr:CD225/dispanin family protein [Aridibacter famidurans]
MSDVHPCPACGKYIDTTFTLEQCPRCNVSLVGVKFNSTAFSGTDITNLTKEEKAKLGSVETWLGLSILSFLFFGCFGIIAIFFAVNAYRAKKSDDPYGAITDMKRARAWSIAAFILGGLAIFGMLAGP